MFTSIPTSVRRLRASVRANAALVISVLVIMGSTSVVRAAPPDSSGIPPSVDIASKLQHPPEYPASAVKKHQQGTVMLDVTVGPTGNVIDIKVEPHGTNAPASLQRAAVNAAKAWKYNPGRKDGNPVGGVVHVPAKFSLQKCDCSRPAPGATSTSTK